MEESKQEYIVTRYEVHSQEVGVKGSSKAEAIKKVADGEGVMCDNTLSYVETIGPDDVDFKWKVEKF